MSDHTYTPRLRMRGEQTLLDHLLDAEAAAERLGITPRMLRRLTSSRRIPFIKVGKLNRFDPADLAAFVEANRVGAAR